MEAAREGTPNKGEEGGSWPKGRLVKEKEGEKEGSNNDDAVISNTASLEADELITTVAHQAAAPGRADQF